MPDRPDLERDTDLKLWFWEVTGFIGNGSVTYAPGRLWEEGPFTNPARMVEDLHGEDGVFMARVWGKAGWWDAQPFDGTTHAHPDSKAPKLQEAHVGVDPEQPHFHPTGQSWHDVSRAELNDGSLDGRS